MNNKEIIGVRDKVPVTMLIPLSLQHTFAMFGASVLVPILFNVNPGIVLLMNGIGTLLFIFITKGKAPAYLGKNEKLKKLVLPMLTNRSFHDIDGASFQKFCTAHRRARPEPCTRAVISRGDYLI